MCHLPKQQATPDRSTTTAAAKTKPLTSASDGEEIDQGPDSDFHHCLQPTRWTSGSVDHPKTTVCSPQWDGRQCLPRPRDRVPSVEEQGKKEKDQEVIPDALPLLPSSASHFETPQPVAARRGVAPSLAACCPEYLAVHMPASRSQLSGWRREAKPTGDRVRGIG